MLLCTFDVFLAYPDGKLILVTFVVAKVVEENLLFTLFFSAIMTQSRARSPATEKVCLSSIITIIFSHLPFCTDIRDFSTISWRSIIGVVPQDPVLFTGTIASNIAFGNPNATREDIEHAAREANCEFVWGMPNGFDTESEHSRCICYCNISDAN